MGSNSRFFKRENSFISYSINGIHVTKNMLYNILESILFKNDNFSSKTKAQKTIYETRLVKRKITCSLYFIILHKH